MGGCICLLRDGQASFSNRHPLNSSSPPQPPPPLHLSLSFSFSLSDTWMYCGRKMTVREKQKRIVSHKMLGFLRYFLPLTLSLLLGDLKYYIKKIILYYIIKILVCVAKLKMPQWKKKITASPICTCAL